MTFRDEVIAQLERHNSDLTKSHQFDFYIYVPTEDAAKRAQATLEGKKYQVKIQPAAKGPGWLCLAHASLTPATAPLDDIHDSLQSIARDLGGEFDGWESDVITK